MKNKDFLKGFFDLFGISDEKQKELRLALLEILTADFIVAFLKEWPEEKRQSFISLVRQGNIDKNSIRSWLINNRIKLSPEAIKRLEQTVKKSLEKFFSCFTEGIDKEKKEKLKKYTEKYLFY